MLFKRPTQNSYSDRHVAAHRFVASVLLFSICLPFRCCCVHGRWKPQHTLKSARQPVVFLSVFLTFHGRKLLYFSFIGERPVLGKLHGHGRRAGGSVVHLAMARLYPEQRIMRLLPRLCPCFVTSLMTGQKTF